MSISQSGVPALGLGVHHRAKPDLATDTRPKISLSRLRQQIRKLPPELAGKCIPSHALLEDVFELGNPKESTREYQEQSAKINLIANYSLDRHSENSFLLRHSLRHGQSRLFNALLKPKPGMELPSLFEIAVIKKDRAAFDKLLRTAEKTQETIPKKTLEFVAACGATDQLERMFPLSELTEDDQTDLLKLAERQQRALKRIRKQQTPFAKWNSLSEVCKSGVGTPKEEAELTLEAIAFIQAGANVKHASHNGHTLLHMASSHNHEEIVHALIQAGANIDATERHNNNTPLHSAALHGHAGIINALIAAGVNVKVANAQGNTPLQWASADGHEGIAQALIQAGANVDASNESGETPLHLAAENGHEGITQLLKAHGATE